MNRSLRDVGILEEIMPVEDLLNEELALVKGGSNPDKVPSGCENGSGCKNGSGCGNGITNELGAW